MWYLLNLSDKHPLETSFCDLQLQRPEISKKGWFYNAYYKCIISRCDVLGLVSQTRSCPLREFDSSPGSPCRNGCRIAREVLAAGSIGLALASCLKFSLNCSLEGRSFMKYFLINLNKKYLALVMQSLEAKRRGLVWESRDFGERVSPLFWRSLSSFPSSECGQ